MVNFFVQKSFVEPVFVSFDFIYFCSVVYLVHSNQMSFGSLFDFVQVQNGAIQVLWSYRKISSSNILNMMILLSVTYVITICYVEIFKMVHKNTVI